MPSSPKRSNRFNAYVVNSAIFFLWAVFRLLECILFLPSIVVRRTSAKGRGRRGAPDRPSRTVVVVGGSFAGLAALRELLAWRAENETDEDLRVVLIDRREYSEYVPGILRLFVDPGRFSDLAQELPGDDGQNGVVLERIAGTVTSIVEANASPGSKKGWKKLKRTLAYLPASDEGRTAGDDAEDDARGENRTKRLDYDCLILATGATYPAPISPATSEGSGTASEANTLLDRCREWAEAHERLRGADRVLILGGGAVGVELAAEILDHEQTRNKTVTIVDAQSTLVPSFPRSVGAYAEKWLKKRGAELRLGQSLKSWNDMSCTLKDGTVLKADVVYVCFGNEPNSQMVRPSPSAAATRNATSQGATKPRPSESDGDRLFSLTRRRNVAVKETLQLVVNDGTDGDDDDDSDVPWFACGDVASPPTNGEKQAFQAEMQGKVAGKNATKLLEGSSGMGTNERKKPDLLRYPKDVAGGDRVPLVFVLSLGRHDGVLGFNGLTIPGALAAVVKWILEYTKVSHMRGCLLGDLVWKVGDAVTLFLSRTLLRSSKTP